MSRTPSLSPDSGSEAASPFSELEWPALIEATLLEARCQPAQARLTRLLFQETWAPSPQVAERLQLETQEMALLLEREGLWGPLSDLKDPSHALERLSKGSTLDLQELHSLRNWLRAGDAWQGFPREETHGEIFKKALAEIPLLTQPLRHLDALLTPEGELSENASPKLFTLFQEIRGLKREIDQVMDQVLRNLGDQGVLQDQYSDVRDGRYVVPVKISAQSEVDGIVYEASVSRQTVFVEPKAVSVLNNKLKARQNQLLVEIDRLLYETSSFLQPFSSQLEQLVDVLAYWDATAAKARVGRKISGKRILISKSKEFSFRNTAHPMLWWTLPPDRLVRNHLELSEPTRALLLTGPNTGGKTVCLKTLGLAGICARTGFPFPASEPPTVPFFESFFVDLGDSQSLSKNISSFSGHLLTFKRILENVTDRSLVLLDELNSATDPEEGAALGRALLEIVMERGALVISTTHDPHLKALATSDPRILCASLAFDETTRSPTYRIVTGVPGRSRALETAERLGLGPEVILRAKGYLSTQHQTFERAMNQLETELSSAAKSRAEANQALSEAKSLKEEWLTRSGAQFDDLLSRTRARLKRILDQAQDEVRAALRKIEEAKSRREVESSREGLNEAFKAARSRLDSALQDESPEAATLLGKDPSHQSAAGQSSSTPKDEPSRYQVGMWVRVPKWKSHGQILALKDKQVKVALGAIQVNLTLADIDLVTSAEQSTLRAQSRREELLKGGNRSAPSASNSGQDSSEIDIRGQRFEEAMSELGAYLDAAFRSGSYAEVRIIHGLGTGVLREGTRKLLKSLPYVKSVRDGASNEGSTGVSVVEFDRH
jgi:DNA mismatch repair protein MutS2